MSFALLESTTTRSSRRAAHPHAQATARRPGRGSRKRVPIRSVVPFFVESRARGRGRVEERRALHVSFLALGRVRAVESVSESIQLHDGTEAGFGSHKL